MSDEMRPQRIIRGWEGIRVFTGYGRTQTQAMIKRGDWPEPIKLGPRAVGWRESDVRQAQDRIAARGRPRKRWRKATT